MSEATQTLRLEPAADPDALYQILVDGQSGLDAEQIRAMEARLILLLANHIGDPGIVAQAVAAARTGLVAQDRRSDQTS